MNRALADDSDWRVLQDHERWSRRVCRRRPAQLAGWGDITPTVGFLEPERLRRAHVNIVGDEFCFGQTSSIEAPNVCAASYEGSDGDSGGAARC